jgi:starvation-inducible DNA-binding protein
MYNTKNTLPENIRVASIALLQDRLSDGIDIMLQTKQAHWNVKGENFIGLHKLFDKVNDSARDWTDLIAERLVQLGGIAEGTIKATAARTTMPDYPLMISTGIEHVEALAKALATYGQLVRVAIDEMIRIGDQDSSDIFIEISRALDKHLWMVEAHNQAGKLIEQKKSKIA